MLVTRLLLAGPNVFFICKNTSEQKAGSKGGGLARATLEIKKGPLGQGLEVRSHFQSLSSHLSDLNFQIQML